MMSAPETELFTSDDAASPRSGGAPSSYGAPRAYFVRRAQIVAAIALAAVGIAACSGKQAPADPEAGAADPEGPTASGVNATVIVAKCPDASRIRVRTAQDAIQRLVGPCASVPGGRAHFSATLEPGGKIVLASPEGDPAEGVVPTCVLQNRLSHRLFLKSPCTLDVQLDERTVSVDRDGGAPDAEAPQGK